MGVLRNTNKFKEELCGFFGAVAHQDVTLDIFFEWTTTPPGDPRGGMLIHDEQDGFQRQIHSIENTPFRTKFEKT